ncbi:uncharacterized protein LOC112564677 isoform X4 [Pomacea canaliculata]|nr:uncharacterized protein LOC112564677 isoform X4 [Pomacea canaliculata]
MFSVTSAVHHLKPEYILQHVLEAEDTQWSTAHLESDPPTSSAGTPPSILTSPSPDLSDPGQLLLRHGPTVRKIHSYFTQLESIKCCMHLAGRTAASQQMRVVHPSHANLLEGIFKQQSVREPFVSRLDDKDLRAFKHAYLCAAYPVLAAPEPPPCYTPSLIEPVTELSMVQQTADAPVSRDMTPYSLHDSGLEESDDLAVIPAESICAHLQQAFHLTEEKFRDYRNLINKTYVKKSAQKEEDCHAELLAEELAGRLAVLENNCHPFYKPQEFMTPSGYKLWRKMEEDHIIELLGKFWQHSLPFPRKAQDLIAELHSIHEDYSIVLGKLMAYEHQFHRQAEEHGEDGLVFLSSASVRLLREFGLRYGVGEMYRRICHFEVAVKDFLPSLGYLRQLLSLLKSITDMFPVNRNKLLIVKRELEILQTSLVLLSGQVTKSLEQMKGLFPGNKPRGGVELLITLLQKVMETRAYLTASRSDPPLLRIILRDIAQVSFFQIYEKCKTLLRTEIKQTRDVIISPRLLNALMMEVRSEVQDYKTNYESVFIQYFDLTALAARAFYSMLMRDVGSLCQLETLRDAAIDLRMLALVYRLNQLDNDWCAYILPQDQQWRQMFQPHLDQWGHVLQLHMQDLILETIGGDAFEMQTVQIVNSGSFSSSPSVGLRSLSFSLTPSVNSAFNSVVSTPREGSSVGSRLMQQRRSTDMLSMEDIDGNNSEQEVISKPFDTHSLTEHTSSNNDFLRFADIRRTCASVPVTVDHPAIVRAISGVRKYIQKGPMVSLHEAESMEDLRTLSSARIIRYKQSGSEINRAENRTGKSDIEDSSFMKGEARDSSGGNSSRDSAEDHGNSSDSSDNEFLFPPIQDVTSLDIAESLKETSQIEDQLDNEQHSAFKALPCGPKQWNEKSKWLNARQEHNGNEEADKKPSLKAGMPLSDREQQSTQSVVSFPFPSSQESIIPVSGSLIDLIVLLHRSLSFGQKLCHTVYPTHVRSLSQATHDMANNTVVLHNTLRTYKVNAYMNVIEGFCRGLSTYADNMLCMDLCAVPGNIAIRVIGSKLVTHVVRQQQAGHIWGCRHQLDGLTSCSGFHNRQALYLCDRYEPISQQMCARINNVAACMHILSWCDKHSQTGFNDDLEVGETSGSILSDLASSGSTTQDPSPVNYTSRGQLLYLADTHLKSIWTALCRLLAFRMNLFLRDGMSLLLSSKPKHVSMKSCLTPVTNFLKDHLNSLSSWLYHQSFQRVIEFLWIYIVQDIEDEARKLPLNKTENITAHSLLQALTHLMRLMNNHGKGITKQQLLSQAESVMMRLQLYTLSTLHLIALHHCLSDMLTSDPDLHLEASPTEHIPLQAIHKLHQELQSLSKCFSGAQLTHWILRHSDLFLTEEELFLCEGEVEMTVQKALIIAQQMLDQHIILDIDTDNFTQSETSSNMPQYPEVSLYTQRQWENQANRDLEVTPTPRKSQEGDQKEGEAVHEPSTCAAPRDTGESRRSSTEGRPVPSEEQESQTEKSLASSDSFSEVTENASMHNCVYKTDPVTNGMEQSGLFEPTPNVPTPILIEQLRRQLQENGEANSDRFSSSSMSSMYYLQDTTNIFENSPQRFYFIPVSSVGSNPPQASSESPSWGVFGMSKSILRMKNSPETIRLAEKCYSLKISTLFILLIVYSRRNVDGAAHSFLMELPLSTLEQLQKHFTTDNIKCTVL